ncbi:chemotaxis protein CheW [Labrys monachus]|uniref:Purine-binding chemotaxis protein CheW n=1 Tax=Labrys monachus TaxID=217067 RepID=A0ABU0FLP3_9HYPH|nr:chemotaxis protein CheW [Labrys monachus]MDQ0395529.1 purine-binding chemotaxis protein CheW [Labrys monachus]
MAEPAALAEGEGEPRRFLTFRSERRLYALPAEDVLEVMQTPDVARVPRAPPFLLGIANLRGMATPLASLSGLLGRQVPPPASSSRAIVLNIGQRVAIVVDGLSALVSIEPDQLESAGAAWAGERGEAVSGAFRWSGHADIVRILDIRALLAAAFVRRAAAERPRGRLHAELPAALAPDAPSWTRYVVFETGGQEYALDVAAVREIVPAPEVLAAMPESEDVVMGLTAYRGGILPLLSMAGLLGFRSAARPDAGSRILVVGIRGTLAGLAVDKARAILDADPTLVEPLPAMLAARSGGETRIKAVYRDEAGTRLVSIVAVDTLFREDIMQRLSAPGRPAAQGETGGSEASPGQSTILVFRLGDEEYGLPISCIEEVAPVPTRISRLPRAPDFLDGVTSHRGEVLPVIDQRRRFDMPAGASLPSRRLVVLRSGGHRAGLIVDGVSEVLRTSEGAIQPPPELTGEATRYVEGVVDTGERGRLVLLLNPAELLSVSERSELDSFTTSHPAPLP